MGGVSGIQLFLGGRSVNIYMENVAFWGTDAGEQVGVEIGNGGSLFQGASVFSVRQGVR